MRLTRFFYQWLRQILFAEKCFHCGFSLDPGRKIICFSCSDFLEPLRENGVIYLAPIGSVADRLLKGAKNNFKQKALLEALVMRAFIEEIPSGIFYTDIKYIQSSKLLPAFFRAKSYSDRSVLKKKTVIVLFEKQTKATDFFCLRLQVSQAAKLITCYLH